MQKIFKSKSAILRIFLPLIQVSILFLFNACGTSNIVIKPNPLLAASTTIKIPFSVLVNLRSVKESYGSSINTFVINGDNFIIALKDFLAESKTFQSTKIIEGNYADFKLNIQLITISLENTMKGFKYTSTMEWQLLNREGNNIANNILSTEYLSKSNNRFTDETDQFSINQIINKAFQQISQQIENTYSQNSAVFSIKPVDKAPWKTVENALINALGAAIADYRIEAIDDLGNGIINKTFEAKQSTIKLLVDQLAEQDKRTVDAAVTSLFELGQNNKQLLSMIILYIINKLPLITHYQRSIASSEIAQYVNADNSIEMSTLYDNELFKLLSDKRVYGIYVDYNKDNFKIDFNYTTNQFGVVTPTYMYSTPILFDFYCGAYLLHKITGQELGLDQSKWKEWWNKNKSNY